MPTTDAVEQIDGKNGAEPPKMPGTVVAVSQGRTHSFSKENGLWIRLIAGFGVEGDAHAGATVKHRSRVARDSAAPNLRQVHLIHSELFEELRVSGFQILPGQLGENVTTRGIDLLGLPAGSLLHIGADAVIEVTGLRNPCSQIEKFCPGLLSAVLEKDVHGNLIRKAGVMGIVLADGEVRPDDSIQVELPSEPHLPLQVV